jgi:hypothetical protein
MRCGRAACPFIEQEIFRSNDFGARSLDYNKHQHFSASSQIHDRILIWVSTLTFTPSLDAESAPRSSKACQSSRISDQNLIEFIYE